MRLIFFGASQLGFKCCQLILEKKLAHVAAIFTIPRKFSISYSKRPVTNVLYADFHSLAHDYNVPLIEIQGQIKEYEETIRNLKPDFICVIGWYYLLPKSILRIPPKGCAGIHGSLLPKYRGGAPLVWAIINGEKKAGITFFYFKDGIDDGDIIAQETFAILENDTIKDILEKAGKASLSVIEKYIPLISTDSAPRSPQNDDEATYVPQRSPEDGLINWSWDHVTIRNFIRAQTKPYPGAFTIIEGKKITLWDADVIPYEE